MNNNKLYENLIRYLSTNYNFIGFELVDINNLSTSRMTFKIRTNNYNVWTVKINYHLKVLDCSCSEKNQHTENSLRTVSELLKYLNDRCVT